MDPPAARYGIWKIATWNVKGIKRAWIKKEKNKGK